MVNKILLATSLLLAATLQTKAQTINDFEDITLSGNNATYLGDIAADGNYSYQTGNIILNGQINYGGTYLTGFNCSNVTDTTDKTYLNSWASYTGNGYNQSDNYGVLYLEAVGPTWTNTIEKALIIDTNSTDKMFNSMYINNTAWGHDYMTKNYGTGDYCTITIKGYKNNALTDSILVDLAHFTNQLELISDWTYINLNKLGIVDSITFQMKSTNDFTPFYFALDQIITSDGNCNSVDSLRETMVNHESITVAWNANLDASLYEIAIDTFNLAQPHITTNIDTTSVPTFTFNNLASNTNYQVFVRSICTNTVASEWKKINIATLPNSITKINNAALNIYPNPTKDILHINNDQIISLCIYSIDGKLIQSYGQTNSINISQYAKGTYVLIGKDKNQQQFAAKIIKE